MKEADIAIVGAGLSGLAAAKILKEAGKNVIVLEARDRVGGKTHTLHDEKHGTADLGGAYVGLNQENVCKLAEEYGLKFYDVDFKGETVLDFKHCYYKYQGLMPPIKNPFVLLDLNNVMRDIDSKADQVPANFPWLAEKAKEWDSMTMKEYIDKICWTRLAKDFMNLLLTLLSCVEPHEVSLLYVLWGVRCGGGVSESLDDAQQKRFLEGSQQLSEKMAEGLGESVILTAPVVRIKQTEKKVFITDKNGKDYAADYAIVAMSPTLLSKLTFEPALPAEKAHLIQRIPMGSVIKTLMYYKERFWRDLDLSGLALSNHGPVISCTDDTRPDGSHPAIVGFIVADQCRDLMGLTPDERKDLIRKHYAQMFKCEKFLQPIDYLEANWVNEEYSGGGYGSVMAPGVLTSLPFFREPFGKIHFAGSETATKWLGYMDGAIQSGYRAANEIIHRLEGKTIPEIPDEPPLDIKRSAIETWLPSVPGVIKGFIIVFLLICIIVGVVVGVLSSECFESQ